MWIMHKEPNQMQYNLIYDTALEILVISVTASQV